MTGLAPSTILIVLLIYFALLYVISYITGKNSDTQTFFTAQKRSPWLLVAVGMIGASLSGVTFISIPGVVGADGLNQSYSYMQMVFGYLIGYFLIATVLMPIYYRLNLVTIYGYLEERFGANSYHTGAAYFILSRLIGASFRLYLVAIVFHLFISEPYGLPFWFTVMISLALIWLYTYKGGIKTIVWTDTIQTIAMLTAVGIAIYFINAQLGTDSSILDKVQDSGLNQLFYWEGGWNDPNNFWKQFISGALIALVMTGLDQDMMQKNLTCRTLKDAQKNMLVFSIVLVFANLLFLTLGVLLYEYAAYANVAIPEKSDQLFPILALNHLPAVVGIFFIIGLIAAAYSSADSALTSLTTSFCVDFLGFEKKSIPEAEKKKTRIWVHLGFTVLLFIIILIFYNVSNSSVINKLFEFAGYTYGPILGLFAFGIFTRFKLNERYVILIAIIAPILSYIINKNSEAWLGGLKLGSMVIALNGALMFLGLLIIAQRNKD